MPTTSLQSDLTPAWDPDHMPCCIECKLILRAVPISATEVYYFCRGCHMSYSLDAKEFGNRPLPPEFQHCSELPKETHYAVR